MTEESKIYKPSDKFVEAIGDRDIPEFSIKMMGMVLNFMYHNLPEKAYTYLDRAMKVAIDLGEHPEIIFGYVEDNGIATLIDLVTTGSNAAEYIEAHTIFSLLPKEHILSNFKYGPYGEYRNDEQIDIVLMNDEDCPTGDEWDEMMEGLREVRQELLEAQRIQKDVLVMLDELKVIDNYSVHMHFVGLYDDETKLFSNIHTSPISVIPRVSYMTGIPVDEIIPGFNISDVVKDAVSDTVDDTDVLDTRIDTLVDDTIKELNMPAFSKYALRKLFIKENDCHRCPYSDACHKDGIMKEAMGACATELKVQLDDIGMDDKSVEELVQLFNEADIPNSNNAAAVLSGHTLFHGIEESKLTYKERADRQAEAGEDLLKSMLDAKVDVELIAEVVTLTATMSQLQDELLSKTDNH